MKITCPECGHSLNPDVERQRQEVGACECPCHPWNEPHGDEDFEKVGRLLKSAKEKK